jgi:hypothetical protein
VTAVLLITLVIPTVLLPTSLLPPTLPLFLAQEATDAKMIDSNVHIAIKDNNFFIYVSPFKLQTTNILIYIRFTCIAPII